MDEVWEDIPGYEGKYQASTMGRIRSIGFEITMHHWVSGKEYKQFRKGRILKPGQFCKSGHVSVVLGRNTIGKPVHQLVALTFLGPCPQGQEVLHNNGNPKDNKVSNLRYGTRTENILDVYHCGGKWRKLSIEDVEEIKIGLITGINGSELARMYQVSPTSISSIKNGRTYRWLK